MAVSLSDFFSHEARLGRKSRLDQYNAANEEFNFVVHAECYTDHQGHHYVELDAESGVHAFDLAKSWCKDFGAVSCAVRSVRKDGSLSKPLRYFN
jgi:hypothetical protein